MELKEFVQKAREHGMHDDEIRSQLLAAGWAVSDVDTAVGAKKLEVPAPPSDYDAKHKETAVENRAEEVDDKAHKPAKKKREKPKGLEYYVLATVLFTIAGSAVWVLDAVIYESKGAADFPLSILIVTLPIALILWFRSIRSKKSGNKSALDAAQLKFLQCMQFVAAAAVLIHVIVFVYLIVSGAYTKDAGITYYRGRYYSQESDNSIEQNAVSLLITLIFAGIVFFVCRSQRRKAQR